MTDDIDGTHLRAIAEQTVRVLAAQTGLTTIVSIGVGSDGTTVVGRSSFSARTLDASYGRLLAVAARTERRDPSGLPAFACALITPEHDVAYLHHHDTGTGLAQVLTVGRNPIDDPGTHLEVSVGLADYMAALTETQPLHRPAGRAFLAEPNARLLILPAPPPPTPPARRGPQR